MTDSGGFRAPGTVQPGSAAAPDAEAWDADRERRVRAWTAVAVASTSQLLYMADATLIALALPEIEREWVDVPRSTIGWAASGFLITQASLLLVGGRVGDRHGRKRFFLFGMALFTLGMMLTAAAPNVWMLIVARVVEGAGAAFLTSGALALVLPVFPPSKSAVVIGVWGVVGTVGAVVAPPLGALVVERSWRLAFVLVVPIGLAAVTLGWRVLPGVPYSRPVDRTDRLSYVIGPLALGALMVAVSNGGRWGWVSAPTLLTLAAALVVLAGFLRRSMRVESALLDVSLFRNRWYSFNLAIGVLQQMGFFAWFLTAPLIMRGMWDWSPSRIGVALALGQVLGMIGAPLGGQVVLRWGYDLAIAIGAAVNVSAVAWVLVTMSAEPSFWGSYAPMALAFGLGNGMCGTVVTGAALGALPGADLGTGNSIVQLTRRMGGAFGVAVGLALLGEASGPDLLDGARRAWLLVAVLHAAIALPLIAGRSWQRKLRLAGA
jgi:EmrB/QacA subfamily drug resistance transporter